jgi:hypothetical protein
MYIETALKRLNAFRADNRERYSFPESYKDEPFARYTFSEILSLATLYPHEATSGDNGKERIEVPGLSIAILPDKRAVVERRGGYTLTTRFTGVGQFPVSVLKDGEGKTVYTRLATSLEFKPLLNRVVGGTVTEGWMFDDRDGYYPESIRQDYHLAGGDSGTLSVKLTYNTREYRIVERGYVNDCDFRFCSRLCSVFDLHDNELVAIMQDAKFNDVNETLLYDLSGNARKVYTSSWTTTNTHLYDGKGRELRRGRFEWMTHRYELESAKVNDALRKSGADRFDHKYLTVSRLHQNFHLDQVPEFPVPEKGESDV